MAGDGVGRRAPGAGKSTIARALATSLDLPWHPIDLWTYDHVARLPPSSTLTEDLARGPEAAAEAFTAYGRARLALVVSDVLARGLGEVPALVEGPQLTPDDAARLPDGASVWLVPTSSRTRRAREERIARSGEGTDLTRLTALLARDAILAERLRAAAAAAGRPVVPVPDDVDWSSVRAQVREALAPVLDGGRRLGAGAALGGQRRFENGTAARQGRLWQQTVGLATLPDYPFGCECGRSGCAETRPGTPDGYDALAAAGPVVATDHRATWTVNVGS